MKLSTKAEIALTKVVEQFRQGDLSPLVKVVRLQLPESAPASQWTFSNRVLAYYQTGELDCRGYRQWQQVGRQVKKGSRAAFILQPMTVKNPDDEEGERKVIGFTTVPVFPLGVTEGEDLPGYELAELPPLVEVAERLGIEVAYKPLVGAYGSYEPATDQIALGDHSAATFFHELAHAAHKRIDGQLQGGQHEAQETVAELSAAVLMEMYGLGDHTGNAWHYISHYADDALMAIVKAMSKVGEVLHLLLTAVDN